MGILAAIGIGAPFGSRDSLGATLAASEFYAPLTHSLVLTRGTGSATFTRATKAWEFGYSAAANSGDSQVLMEIASGTPRFGGARYDSGTWYNTYADGSAISSSTLLGYHAEGARTNNLLYSRDLRYGTTNIWKGVASGAEKAINAGFDADTDWTKYGVTISGGVCVFSAAATGSGVVQSGVLTPGKSYTVSFDVTGYASGSVIVGCGLVEPAPVSADGTYTYTVGPVADTAIRVICRSANTTLNVDNISVKEAAIQPTLTATGIDGAANSATTLTAAAADATILQTLTLASAARSSSAYVKRRTGTGNIYFTRDGGTNWTDITASLGASWTRVKIENTSVLNPSIGFKIATSGDAIDVDCVQDEAGAKITSPIITTTAAVTRNADAHTDPTASNWSDTAGWALATVYSPDWSSVAGGIIGSATNGLLPLTTNTGAKAYDGTNTVNGPAGAPSGTVKAAMTWGGGALQVAANGTAGTAGSYDGAWGLASIGIGTSTDSMYIKNVYIAQTALTDAQLQQVTS